MEAEKKTRKKIRQRSCFICRKVEYKDYLMRFVCGKDGIVQRVGLNTKAGVASGRSAYLHDRAECLAKAVRIKAWQNVFKRKDLNAEELFKSLKDVKGTSKFNI